MREEKTTALGYQVPQEATRETATTSQNRQYSNTQNQAAQRRKPIGFKTASARAQELEAEKKAAQERNEAFADYEPIPRENKYLECLQKAFYEFLVEEAKGFVFTEERMVKKIEAARKLFPEDKDTLRFSILNAC